MAIRTTKSAVEGILDADYLKSLKCDFNYTPFMETANGLVDAVCLESGYSNALLELIERWLAAHFTMIMAGQLESEDIGKSSNKYAAKTGYNLALTKWGQQAMVLDVRGNLSQLNRATDPEKGVRRGRIIWGAETCPCDNNDYENSNDQPWVFP